MTTEEKAKLRTNIGKLTLEQKKKIVPIVQECVSKSGKTSVFEFELDQLSVECLNELETYVKKTIKDNEKKQKRREADIRRRKN